MHEAGFTNFDRIAKSTESRIKDCTNQGVARGIIQQAQKMPKLGVSLSILSEKKRDDGLAVQLDIKVFLKSKFELPESSATMHKKLPKAKISILVVTNDEVWKVRLIYRTIRLIYHLRIGMGQLGSCHSEEARRSR